MLLHYQRPINGVSQSLAYNEELSLYKSAQSCHSILSCTVHAIYSQHINNSLSLVFNQPLLASHSKASTRKSGASKKPQRGGQGINIRKSLLQRQSFSEKREKKIQSTKTIGFALHVMCKPKLIPNSQ